MSALYIAKMRIKGFQAHEDSEIHLGPGLNVITGPTDSGKTAIIRAVRWIAFNEPQGEHFLNKKVGEVEVTLCMSNGIEVTKRRRKGKTSYHVSTIPEPFEKSEVPLEVTQALEIAKQTFGDFTTALNFSFQLDPPFLISETASAGAKILGKIAGTEAVDVAIKDVSKDTYAARQDRAQAERDMNRVDEQLGHFIELDNLREQLTLCERQVEQLAKDVEHIDNLKHLAQQHTRVKEGLVYYQEQLDKLASVPLLIDTLTGIEATQGRHSTLLNLYSQFIRINNDVRTLDQRIESLAAIDGLGAQVAQVEQDMFRAGNLRRIETTYTGAAQVMTTANRVLQSTKGLEEAQQLLTNAELNHTKVQQLRNLAETYSRAWTTLTGLQLHMENFAQLPAAENHLQEIAKAQARLTILQGIHRKHELNLLSRSQATRNYDDAINTWEEAKNALSTSWDGLTMCPLCEKPIEGGHDH